MVLTFLLSPARAHRHMRTVSPPTEALRPRARRYHRSANPRAQTAPAVAAQQQMMVMMSKHSYVYSERATQPKPRSPLAKMCQINSVSHVTEKIYIFNYVPFRVRFMRRNYNLDSRLECGVNCSQHARRYSSKYDDTTTVHTRLSIIVKLRASDPDPALLGDREAHARGCWLG